MKIAILILTLSATTFAQELLPELQPFAAKHAADSAALTTQRDATLARGKQSYLAALDSAERAATNASQIPLVAAIVKERDGVNSGLMAPVFPAGLPKSLEATRKSMLSDTAKITNEYVPRFQHLEADYLKALATLSARAAGNPELAKQIAAQKQLIIAGNTTASGATAPRNGKSLIVNGDFTLRDEKGAAAGWGEYDMGTSSQHVITDGGNSFFKLTEGGIYQSVEIPKGKRKLVVTAKVRANVLDDKGQFRITVRPYNEAVKLIARNGK